MLLPWYALDDYVPNGWDATWWARLALGAALAGLALTSVDARPRREWRWPPIAVAAIAFRLAVAARLRLRLRRPRRAYGAAGWAPLALAAALTGAGWRSYSGRDRLDLTRARVRRVRILRRRGPLPDPQAQLPLDGDDPRDRGVEARAAEIVPFLIAATIAR